MNCILGIDTSNYTTSAAVVTEDGVVIADARRMLSVAKGRRGLRQSDAVFQHVRNLPQVIEEAMEQARAEDDNLQISAIAASSRPRPVSGSYMPCFLPGENFARSMAQVLGVRFLATSHQEGHIAALLPECGFDAEEGFLSFHLSGGTCELLDVVQTAPGRLQIEIVGGSRDISFGQLIDRVGVALGMSFPAGAQMDRVAIAGPTNLAENEIALPKIKCIQGYVHVSGIEAAAMRLRDAGYPEDRLIEEIFYRMGQAVVEICRHGSKMTGRDKVMLAGGVSTSRTLGRYIKAYNMRTAATTEEPFIWKCDSDRGRDNATGVALTGLALYNSGDRGI
ncbi:MAG: hypothetical protein ACOX4I_06240 [Anaerovoracaceae bacterium]|jgi:N6-L-threonylcarbamoyladenine synthase